MQANQETTGRAAEGGWATNVVLVLAILAMCATAYWQYLFAWSPLEHFYGITYAQTWVRDWLLPGSSDIYAVYFVETRQHQEQIADKGNRGT